MVEHTTARGEILWHRGGEYTLGPLRVGLYAWGKGFSSLGGSFDVKTQGRSLRISTWTFGATQFTAGDRTAKSHAPSSKTSRSSGG